MCGVAYREVLLEVPLLSEVRFIFLIIFLLESAIQYLTHFPCIDNIVLNLLCRKLYQF